MGFIQSHVNCVLKTSANEVIPEQGDKYNEIILDYCNGEIFEKELSVDRWPRGRATEGKLVEHFNCLPT